MKLTNQAKENIMSSLQGYVTATIDQLIEIFGAPNIEESWDEKVSTEFEFVDFEGNRLRIYDWKEYDGGWRCRDGNVYEWHIGGSEAYVVEIVNEMLDVEGYDMTATTCRR